MTAEDQVRGRAAGRHSAGETDPYHFRELDKDRLAEHSGRGLDAADAPAEDTEAVYHRGMGIGSDERIGAGGFNPVLIYPPDHFPEVFKIDLVADAGRRRDHFKISESFLPPVEEFVPLAVALELLARVHGEGFRRAVSVHLHAVVYDQVDGKLGIYLLRVPAQPGQGVAERRQVRQRRHPGKILHEHARRHERDFGPWGGFRIIAGEVQNVFGRDLQSVLGAQRAFEQYFYRKGQTGKVHSGLAGKGRKPVIRDAPLRQRENGTRTERI